MRRHPGTFVAGLLFMAIGFAYVLDGLEVWQVKPGRLWPIALIVIGAVVLFAGRTERGVELPDTIAENPPTDEDPQPS